MTTTFSVCTALGGLLVISFCFKLLLSAEDIIGDSKVFVYDKSSDELRTTSLTPENVSPASDSKRSSESLDSITKRVGIVAFSVGISAVVFGLAGICTAKIKRCLCTCSFGFLSLVFTILYVFAAVVLLSMYYVTDQQLQDFCNDNLNLDDTEGLVKRMIEEIEDYVYTVDKELKYAVNAHMCTDFCPCKDDWDFRVYGTAKALNFADDRNNDYNFNGDQSVFTECYA